MILFREPRGETVARFLASQAACEFTYCARARRRRRHRKALSSITRGSLSERERPHSRKPEQRFQRWDQFRLGWVEARSPAATIQPGDPVAVIARQGFVWWLNACRIIYVIDEQQPIRHMDMPTERCRAHVASGEERFLVEWNPADQVVWYDILVLLARGDS